MVNAQDSLDHDYPMYVPFSIPANTVKVVSVYVNFWQLPFRAYSKAAASSQQLTTAAGEAPVLLPALVEGKLQAMVER